MDVEVTMEDLATMAEDPEITQGPAVVEGISKEAFSRTRSSFMITRDSTT